MSSGPDKAEVRAFFESEVYVHENPLIPVRARTVASLLDGVRGGRILDLGCGDGAISRPLLAANNQLTLVDFSNAMLERARGATPRGAPVEFISADILTYVPDTLYDAVLCIGVLAHLPSIEPMIQRVAQFTRPGGVCVFQITDDDSPLGWALNRYRRLRPQRPAYTLNVLARSDVIAIADRYSLTVRDTRKYALSIPGSARLPRTMRHSLEASFAGSPLLSRAGAETMISFDRLR